MTTRRSFVKLAAAGSLVALARPLLALNPLDIGIGTYSYHSESMDEMIVQLNRLRIDQIEMSRGEFMLLSHPKAPLFETTRQKLDKAGIRCLSYYSATINNDQDLEDAIRFAGILGSLNITGDAPAGMLSRIDQRLTEEALTFGLHNHFFPNERFAYESPQDVLQALAPLSTTMGATADTGHFASCGYDPADAIRKLAPRLRMVHLKDVRAKGGEVNVLLGTGVARIPEVMQQLHRLNFSGLIAIEYEKEGDVNEDMVREVAYARKLAN